MNLDFFVGIFSQPVPRTQPLVGFCKRTSAGQPIPRYPHPTFSMTPEERRLAVYARYRHSGKCWERTRRYNSSPAHRQANQRYRDSHVRGPESYQDHNGRWTGLMKVDPADKPVALWQAQHGRHFGGLNAAERMVMGLGLNSAMLHDEEAGNRLYAEVAKPYPTDHERMAKYGITLDGPDTQRSSVREHRIKKYRRQEANDLRAVRARKKW